MSRGARIARVLLACVAPVMLTVAIPFVNRIEPRIFGLPFLLAWIVLAVLMAPVTLGIIFRLEGRAKG